MKKHDSVINKLFALLLTVASAFSAFYLSRLFGLPELVGIIITVLSTPCVFYILEVVSPTPIFGEPDILPETPVAGKLEKSISLEKTAETEPSENNNEKKPFTPRQDILTMACVCHALVIVVIGFLAGY